MGGGLALAAALTLTAGTQAAVVGAQAATSATPVGQVTNPYSPAYHHSYRHGVVPTIGTEAKMRSWRAAHPSDGQASANDLNYGGGIDGIGVTTGHEKVYLVFYGSQWGTQGTDGSGNVTLSGDPSGEAPYVQKLMKGLGTSGELWSGVMTQYCDGAAAGAQSCPASNASHVAYPTGGAYAGVWVDESIASPSQATGPEPAGRLDRLQRFRERRQVRLDHAGHQRRLVRPVRVHGYLRHADHLGQRRLGRRGRMRGQPLHRQQSGGRQHGHRDQPR